MITKDDHHDVSVSNTVIRKDNLKKKGKGSELLTEGVMYEEEQFSYRPW